MSTYKQKILVNDYFAQRCYSKREPILKLGDLNYIDQMVKFKQIASVLWAEDLLIRIFIKLMQHYNAKARL